jgi:CRP-like cAMP-binding protein
MALKSLTGYNRALATERQFHAPALFAGEHVMTMQATSPFGPLIRLLSTYHPIGDAERAALLALPYNLRTREPQSYLVREGDRPTVCGVLVTGYAFRHKITGNGDRQILAINIPGEPLDLQHLMMTEADHNVQMLTRGQVADVPIAAMEQLIVGHPELARALQVFLLVEASVFREWTVNVGRREAKARVAHLLCELAVRLDAQGLLQDGAYELPMTQEQLADATGLTPVHVNRTLKALETQGLIERSRRVIRIPQWERLRDAGDFNERYLHMGHAA